MMQILKNQEKNVHTNTHIYSNYILCQKIPNKAFYKRFIKVTQKPNFITTFSSQRSKKILSYTATQSQLNCKPNSNLAHP